MKILIVTNSSSGLYKFRKELIKKLINKGNYVKIITPFNGFIDELEKLGCEFINIKIDRRGKNIFKEISLFLKYKQLIKKENPDIIISYTIKPNIYCGLISRIYKKDFFPNITGVGSIFQKESILKKLVCFTYRISLKKSKKIFFENEYNNKIFIKEKICTKNNSIILNGAGVNLEEFKFESLSDFKNINFIFIGRIMKEKGVDELFYVIEEIKKEYKNINFLILGKLEENYKNKLKEMEEKNLLKYYGVKKDVREFIKLSHCCILPSYHEGMSNALLECASMGRALITSNIPGCKEAVVDGKSGFLTEVRNKEDLKEKVLKYINSTNNDKKKMGLASRKHIENNFDKKEVIDITFNNILE